MIRSGFLSGQDRVALVGIARGGLAEDRIARRANAMVLLDQGWSCERVAAALLLDDDTVRNWHRAYERGGVEGLRVFGHEGGSSRLSSEQETALSDWVRAQLPRSTRLNLHGAINRETGRTEILDVERVDGPSLIKLRRIQVFLDNATYVAPSSSGSAWQGPNANACWASCQPIAPISIPSNDRGG